MFYGDAILWYDKNFEEYAEKTRVANMEDLYAEFLGRLPDGASILDAGCGIGRDARAFLYRGYEVTAFDASGKLVEAATKFTGIQVQQLRFEDVQYSAEFDGIWAMASLLHVRRHALPAIIQRLSMALKEGGLFFMSFKKGEAERVDNEGRFFNDHTVESIRRVIDQIGGLVYVQGWESSDPGNRKDVIWTNALAKRVSDKLLE